MSTFPSSTTRISTASRVVTGDPRFTKSTESRCGVTYREKVGDPVVTSDIVDKRVVSTSYRGSSSSLVIDMPYT